MSFTQVYGGSAVKPSQPSFLALTIAADTELVWPIETTAGSPVVAAMINVTASTTSLGLAMPPGNTGSTGVATMITNVGANTFTLTDQAGNAIVAIPTTQAWLIALTDNSTANGTWVALQMASTTSSATAAALAGPGLKAVGPLLELNYIPIEQSADFVVTAAYRAKVVEWTGSIDGQMQLDTLANLTPGWSFMISNPSDFTVYLTTSGGDTIDNLSGIDIKSGQSVLVCAGVSQFLTFGVLIGQLPIDQGGTGAGTAAQALINLGGTSLGIGIFTAPNAASVIALLGLNNFTFRESTVSTNQAVTSSAGNTAYVATAAITATLPLTTLTIDTSYVLSFYAQGGNITITPNATDAINGAAAGTSMVLLRGSSVLLTTDANGNWWPFFLAPSTSSTWAAAGGSNDVITATYAPAIPALTDGLLLGFRAGGPNNTATPTFSPNGLTARTITKYGGGALALGDICNINAEVLLRYNLANTRWELLNPASAISNWTIAGGSANAITAAVVLAGLGGLYDGLLIGFRATAANTSTAPTINVNSIGVRTITRDGGSPLVAGDIPAALAECVLRYNLANTRWELLNPAVGLQAGGYYLQTGTATLTLGSGAVTYSTAFPTETKAGGVSVTISAGSAAVTLHPAIVGATDRFGFLLWGDATETVQVNWQAWGR